MPAAAALVSTAAPLALSRLTIIRTATFSLIIWSAIDWNLVTSPLAFWMSYWTPAVVKAAVSNGRSLVSQRAEDAESGRMTPIFGVAADAEVDVDADAAGVEAVELLPLAVSATTATETPATAMRERLRM